MTNLTVAGMSADDFWAEYQKVNANHEKKAPFNTGIPLEEQLKKFEAASFSEEDDKALHEDILSI
jgi:HD superfamily phosphodiesterase